VGEIAYHYDSEYAGYVANVIVFSKFRGNGYGAKGLELLCTAAKGNGITALYDDNMLREGKDQDTTDSTTVSHGTYKVWMSVTASDGNGSESFDVDGNTAWY